MRPEPEGDDFPPGTTFHARAELPGGHVATAEAGSWAGLRAGLADSVAQLTE